MRDTLEVVEDVELYISTKGSNSARIICKHDLMWQCCEKTAIDNIRMFPVYYSDKTYNVKNSG